MKKKMNKRKLILPLVLVGMAIVLSACTKTVNTNSRAATNVPLNTNTARNNSNSAANTNAASTNTNTITSNSNTNTNVSNKTVLAGNICNVFTSDYVTSILGANVVKAEAKTDTGVTACLYHTSTSTTNPKFVEIAVESFNVANIKQGYVQVGTSTKADPRLGANDFLGLRTDNSVRGIYLVMNPNKVVTVSSDTPTTQPISDDAMIQFAVKLETRLVDYQ
jgi:hypothetical protein